MPNNFLTMFFLGCFFCSTSIAKTPKTIELTKLIDTFLPSKNSSISWSTAATANSPVKWTHSGLMDSSECTSLDDKPPYCRRGFAFVTVNGQITHTRLQKTIQPGKWFIDLYGFASHVNRVDIASDSVPRDNINSILGEEFELLKTLTAAKMKLTPLKCFSEMTSSGSVLYKIESINKPTAWLLNGYSCGASASAECSSHITIYYNFEDIKHDAGDTESSCLETLGLTQNRVFLR